MHIGSELMYLSGSDTMTVYTPWFPRGADNAVFTYEIIHQYFGGGGGMSVTVYTKNVEEAGSAGTAYSSWTNLYNSEFFEQACTNLKQLVRFEITLTGGTSPTGPQGVLYRFLPPTWYDNTQLP